MAASGKENLKTLFETGKRPASKINTKGYIPMRWYQHRTQGGNFMTSLKNRLPMVAILATSQAPKSVPQALLIIGKQ